MKIFTVLALAFSLSASHFICDHCFVELEKVEIAQKDVKKVEDGKKVEKHKSHYHSCVDCCCVFVLPDFDFEKVEFENNEISLPLTSDQKIFVFDFSHPPRLV